MNKYLITSEGKSPMQISGESLREKLLLIKSADSVDLIFLNLEFKKMAFEIGGTKFEIEKIK